MNKTKYLCSCSGGKDSCAQVILAHLHDEPLDEIIFSEVMFSENVSGEYPEHMDFIHNTCIPLFTSWGYPFKILRSDKTYLDCFLHRVYRTKHIDRIGKHSGFPMAGRCNINRECKVKPINQYLAGMHPSGYVQYIGIAVDEPERLARLRCNQISLLEKYNLTEQNAYDLCKKYGLLSPLYQFAKRGGCWFCPNATMQELRYLYDKHPDFFRTLLKLEETPDLLGYMFNTLKRRSLHDVQRIFENEDNKT